MARPQSPDYDDRKQIILDQAAGIFAAEGYHKAAISQVTKACGISKSLIYHYFPSKQDILYHTLISHVQELDKLARAIVSRGLSSEDCLHTIVHEYLNVYKDRQAQHHLLVNELGSLEMSQRKEIITFQNNVVEIFAELANDLSPLSLETRKAKKAVAFLLLGMINWTYTWFKPDGPVSPDELSEIIFRLLIGGLRNLDADMFNK